MNASLNAIEFSNSKDKKLSLIRMFFHIKGRISRLPFFFGVILINSFVYVNFFVYVSNHYQTIPISENVFLLVMSVLNIIFLTPLIIKRLHDCNLPAYIEFVFILLFPIFPLFMLFLIIKPGSNNSNRYGFKNEIKKTFPSFLCVFAIYFSISLVFWLFVLKNPFSQRVYTELNKKDQNIDIQLDSVYLNGNKYAKLHIEQSLGDFIIQDKTSELLSFNLTNCTGNYEISTQLDLNKIETINIKPSDSDEYHSIKDGKMNVKLNENPIWNIYCNCEKATILMDFRKFMIDTAVVTVKSSSFDIKFGNKWFQSFALLNTKDCSIKIFIPKETGITVKSNSLNGIKGLEGMGGILDNNFQSSNFAISKNKISLTLEVVNSKIEFQLY